MPSGTRHQIPAKSHLHFGFSRCTSFLSPFIPSRQAPLGSDLDTYRPRSLSNIFRRNLLISRLWVVSLLSVCPCHGLGVSESARLLRTYNTHCMYVTSFRSCYSRHLAHQKLRESVIPSNQCHLRRAFPLQSLSSMSAPGRNV